jgi:hypothetical protein
MSPDVARARRMVEARLGRAPQDALEAAVVLEAWAGVPAQRALETARALMPKQAAQPLVSTAAPATPQRPPRLLLEGVPFIVTVTSIALWAEPLAAALGVGAVKGALGLALPLTLGLQWALLCRHLGRPSGLAGLARRRGPLAAAAAVVVAASAALLGPAGALAGLLTVTWVGGGILIRRGWAAGYCLAVGAAVPAMLAGAPPLEVVGAAATITAVASFWALGTAGEEAAIPGRWSRTIGGGLTGAGVGVLLVADPSVSWTGGAAPALALLPSAAGAVWAGQHLWKLAAAFPRALAGVPACEPPSRRHATGWAAPLRAVRGVVGRASLAPVWALGGAIWRLGALTVAGSAVLLALTPWLGAGPSLAGVLAGYGVVALATLLVGLLESLGRPSVAAAGVAAGVAGAVLVRLADPPFSGAALLAGGALAVLVLLPAALALLARPARTLATTLWIT